MGRAKVDLLTRDQYVWALCAVDVTANQRRMLTVHYHAPERTVTATQMAAMLGWPHYGVVNAQYGKLGRLVAEELGIVADAIKTRLGTLVEFDHRDGEWHWQMRPELARALEALGWV